MTDKELLELAAKASGVELNWVFEPIDDANSPAGWMASIVQTSRVWNPLTDDGDAIRLAVKLDLLTNTRFFHERITLMTNNNIQKLEATRRTIVKAAAEIGMAMK